MAFEFSNPLWLWLLLPLLGLIYLVARRWPAQGAKARLSHLLHQTLAVLTILSLSGLSVLSPAREYDLRVADRGALAALSQDTGGRTVADPASLMDFPQSAARSRRSMVPALTLLSLVLLLADIAQRRLNWGKTPPAPVAKAPKPKARQKPQASPKPVGETAQQLWNNLQNRKRL